MGKIFFFMQNIKLVGCVQLLIEIYINHSLEVVLY